MSFWSHSDTEDEDNESFETTIRISVHEFVQCKFSLDFIKQQITNLLECTYLSPIAEHHVEHHYFQYCLHHLLNEIRLCLEEEASSLDQLELLASQSLAARKLADLPPKIQALSYLRCITKENRVLSKHQKSLILHKLQCGLAQSLKVILKETCTRIDDATAYLRTLKDIYLTEKAAFLTCKNQPLFTRNEYLELWNKYAQDHPNLAQQFEQKFEDFKTDLNHFQEMVDADPIIKQSIQTSSSALVNHFLSPVVSQTGIIDGKSTLIIKRPVVLLSEYIVSMENAIKSQPSIEEVHIIASEVFYIDCNLPHGIWHGKNVLVTSKKIQCILPNLVWDLSGEDGQSASKEPAPKGSDDNIDGSDGQDGSPGESGGSCVFLADYFRKMDFLTVKCNGGTGGTGQKAGDGKNGKKGSDGKEMSMSEFKTKFPSPAKFVGKSSFTNYNTSVTNIRSMIKGSFQNSNDWETYVSRDTTDGLHIEFSFYEKGFYREGYCLIRGGLGTGGTAGGFKGYGGAAGEGGHLGKIMVRYWNNSAKQDISNMVESDPICHSRKGDIGDVGADGQDGARGENGSNGKDVGYTDRWPWSDTNYSGPGTYELRDTTNGNGYGDEAWCPWYERWRSLYSIRRNPPQDVTCTRQRRQRIRHKVAAKQKNSINVNEAMNMYSSEIHGSNLHENVFNRLELEDRIHNVITATEEAVQKLKVIKPDAKIKTVKPVNLKKRKKKKNSKCAKPFQPKTSDRKEDIVIRKIRLQTLENICANNNPISEYHEADTKTKFIKCPTSKKFNASGIHALFGTENDIGYYETSVAKRKEVCNKLKDEVDNLVNDETALKHLRQSLQAYFNDETEEAVNKESFKFQWWPFSKRNQQKTLDKYGKDFKLNLKSFSWETVLQDKGALTQYFDFLSLESIPFLTSDLQLIAHVYNIRLLIYDSPNESQQFFLLQDEAQENENDNDDDNDKMLVNDCDVRVSVNEKHEFSRMDIVVSRDLKNVYTKMSNIVAHVYNMQCSNDITRYINSVQFTSKSSNVVWNHEEITTMETIKHISESLKHVTEDKLLIEMPLLMWPPLLVQVFYDRICETFQTNSVHLTYNVRFTFSKITEFILNSPVCDGDDDEETFSPLVLSLAWVLGAYPITQWPMQICVLSVEEYFERVTTTDVTTWTQLISKFPSRMMISLVKLVSNGDEFDTIDKNEFTKFLESLQKCHLNDDLEYEKLDGLGRSQWPYQLKKLLLTSVLNKLPNVNWNNDENTKSQSLYYIHALYNEKPEQVLQFLEIMHDILTMSSHKKKQLSIALIMKHFYSGIWHLNDENIQCLKNKGNVDEWMTHMFSTSILRDSNVGQERKLDEIFNIIESDKNSTLTKNDRQEIFQLIGRINSFKMPEHFKENIDQEMKKWLPNFKTKVKKLSLEPSSLKYQMEAVAYVNFVIRANPKLSYFLRDTQKTAIATALYLGSHKKNMLTQIATGEGKTCVVLAVAIVRGLFDEKTDVVTSSGVLAQRDAEAYADIYEAFGLTVGEVTHDNQEERSKAYTKTVVYGEVCNYERDYLLGQFYNQNVRGAREYGNVIVDEVDSMFLDKGNSVLYLSHQPPDLDSLEGIFVFIWTNVVQAVNSGDYDPETIHELVLSAMYPTITIQDLLTCTKECDVDELWKYLVKANVINENGRISLKWRVTKFEKKIPPKFLQIKKQLTHIIQCKVTSVQGKVTVMNYLKPFVEQHLSSWISSAHHATQLSEGKEYVVDVDHSSGGLDKNPKIMILDLDTGVDMKESQWNEGLHQFLQLKHGCQLSLMSLKAVFISNITFFNMYTRIVGLTGTIGTESDRKFLKSAYTVEFLSMPVALQKRFIEEVPQICVTVSQWQDEIYKDVHDKLDNAKKPRSVLIICGTVQEAESLQNYFSRKGTKHTMELYRRDYEQFKATDNDNLLGPRQIIIATNLAGRGTDIKLTDELKQNGGLHVILSYLPDNLRVEQQAFGRAARCGDPGSGRLIFIDYGMDSEETRDAIYLKMQRDEEEMSRVAEIQTYYNTVIHKEENMFKEFQKSFDKLTSALEKAYQDVSKDRQEQDDKNKVENLDKLMSGNINEIKELVMYSMLDDWAFWLDKYSTLLLAKRNPNNDNIFDKGLHKFQRDEEKVLQEFFKMVGRYEEVSSKYKKPGDAKDDAGIESYALPLIHEPALVIKLAKVFAYRKRYVAAHSFLEKVVTDEPDHAAVAMYYQVYCKLKEKSWENPEFQTLVQSLMCALEDYRMRQATYSSAISQMAGVGSQKIILRNGYEEQKQNVIKILEMHRSAIETMVGNESLTPADFQSFCNEEGEQQFVCDHLVQIGALLGAQFCFPQSEHKWTDFANSFCLSTSHLKTVWRNLNGKALFPLEKTQKIVKDKLHVPYRGGFWKEIKDCLVEIQSFVVIQPENVAETDSTKSDTEKAKQNDFSNWISPNPKRKFVSKYGSDMSPKSVNQIIKGCKETYGKKQKFIHLRKKGQVCYEKVGFVNIEKLRNKSLTKFHQIEKNAFTLIEGITEIDSDLIFQILFKNNIVDTNGTLLSTEWSSDKLNLTLVFEAYRADILAILQSKCRYKYELLSLIHQFDHPKDTTNELKNNLPSRPIKDLIMYSMDNGFIRGLKPNKAHFPGKNFFEMVFNQPNEWFKWVDEKIGVNSKPSLNHSDLKSTFPHETDENLKFLYAELKTKQWLNASGEILQTGDKKVTDLSPQYEYHQPYLLSLCKWRHDKQKKEFMKDIYTTVYESLGKLTTLESPDGKLIDLESKFPDNGEKAKFAGEICMFTLCGFEHVIDTIEETYTWKMIFSAIAVIIIGLVQIGIGLCIEFYSMGSATFIASGFIQEGIGDLIYGLMAFKSGHFSWQDWADQKWQSIAITAATLFIGAMISKGAKYSKFGQRLFGDSTKSGRLVAEGLKAGQKGMARGAFGAVMKSFGYKVIQGVATAGGSMAVSYAYEKALKQFIDHFSEQLFANTYETIDNHIVSGQMSTLVDKVGLEQAERIKSKCVSRAMQKSLGIEEAYQSVSLMLSPILNGITAGASKLKQTGKGGLFNNPSVEIILKVLSIGMTTASFAVALTKLKGNVTQFLDEISKEIEREISKHDDKQQYVESNKKVEFVYKFKEETKELMRQKLGSIVQHQFIEPLMNKATQSLLRKVGRGIRGKYVQHKEARLAHKVEKVKYDLESTSCEETKRENCKKLVQLCCKSRDPKLIAYAIEAGAPLGIESIQALANSHNVTIVIHSDNEHMPKIISPTNSNGESATLHLQHHAPANDSSDVGHWESKSTQNAESGETSDRSSFNSDCLLNAINQELRSKCPDVAEISRSELSGFIRTDPEVKAFVKQGLHHTFNYLGAFGGGKPPLRLQLELHKDKRDKAIQELKNDLEDFRSKPKMEPSPNPKRRRASGKTPAEDPKPNPVNEFYYTENGGETVLSLQLGEVTLETLNTVRKSNSTLAKHIRNNGCPVHDEAGHVTSDAHGGKYVEPNLAPQAKNVNRRMYRSVEKSISSFMKKQSENNPSVEYTIKLHYEPGEIATRPTGFTVKYIFKLNGNPLVGDNNATKVYHIKNTREKTCVIGRKCHAENKPPEAG